MITLSRSEAISAVRKNLDELELGTSAMYNSGSTDDEALDIIIARTLPDAINEVNLAAPLNVLEGISLRAKYTEEEKTKSDYTDVSVDSEKVLSFSFNGPFLRLVSLRVFDTPHTVDGVILENTAEARMQLNKYIRGTYDRPRLVMLLGGSANPRFRYYSLKDASTFKFSEYLESGTGTFPIESLEYVPLAVYKEEEEEYQIADVLRSPIINQLTAKVLSIFKNTEFAEHFYNSAKSMLQ